MDDQELGKLFAEKVLGWHYAHGYWVDGTGKRVAGGFPILSGKYPSWHPCTDLNQAMLGFEKLEECGWGYFGLDKFRGREWRASTSRMREARDIGAGGVDNHPACAIVKACLEAMGEEISDG